MHDYGGAYGIPGGLERWQHGSYRWRRGLEAVLVVMLAVVLAPKMLALTEVVAGFALMCLLMLVWWLLPRGLWRRFDLLALLLAILALVEARKRH